MWYVGISHQVFQEEFGIIKSYNLKPGGDKIPVTNQNRKGKLKHLFLIKVFAIYFYYLTDVKLLFRICTALY